MVITKAIATCLSIMVCDKIYFTRVHLLVLLHDFVRGLII